MANMIDYNKNLNIQEVKRIVKKIIQEEFNFDFVSK
jgi:lipoyl(octanoyl) transferase